MVACGFEVRFRADRQGERRDYIAIVEYDHVPPDVEPEVWRLKAQQWVDVRLDGRDLTDVFCVPALTLPQLAWHIFYALTPQVSAFSPCLVTVHEGVVYAAYFPPGSEYPTRDRT